MLFKMVQREFKVSQSVTSSSLRIDRSLLFSSEKKRILIFNCTSGRSGNSLLGTLLEELSPELNPFSHVIFCTNTTYSGGVSKGGKLSCSALSMLVLTKFSDLTSNAVDKKDLEELTIQTELATAWSEVSPLSTATVQILGSIQEAVELARKEGDEVLVTGSLHLVGGVMAFSELEVL